MVGLQKERGKKFLLFTLMLIVRGTHAYTAHNPTVIFSCRQQNERMKEREFCVLRQSADVLKKFNDVCQQLKEKIGEHENNKA